jgi:hypothetical protein
MSAAKLPSKLNAITVFVKQLNGEVMEIECSSKDYVLKLKQLIRRFANDDEIEKEEPSPTFYSQRLMMLPDSTEEDNRGQDMVLLHDERALFEYKIGHGTMLFLFNLALVHVQSEVFR